MCHFTFESRQSCSQINSLQSNMPVSVSWCQNFASLSDASLPVPLHTAEPNMVSDVAQLWATVLLMTWLNWINAAPQVHGLVNNRIRNQTDRGSEVTFLRPCMCTTLPQGEFCESPAKTRVRLLHETQERRTARRYIRTQTFECFERTVSLQICVEAWLNLCHQRLVTPIDPKERHVFIALVQLCVLGKELPVEREKLRGQYEWAVHSTTANCEDICGDGFVASCGFTREMDCLQDKTLSSKAPTFWTGEKPRECTARHSKSMLSPFKARLCGQNHSRTNLVSAIICTGKLENNFPCFETIYTRNCKESNFPCFEVQQTRHRCLGEFFQKRRHFLGEAAQKRVWSTAGMDQQSLKHTHLIWPKM